MMSSSPLNFSVHSNGHIRKGSAGDYYEGPPPAPILLSSDISYEQLCTELFEELNIEQQQYKLEILFRSPNHIGNSLTFGVVSIHNDRGVRAMMHKVTQMGAMATGELYVRHVSVNEIGLGMVNQFESYEAQGLLTDGPPQEINLEDNSAHDADDDDPSPAADDLFGDEDVQHGITDPSLMGRKKEALGVHEFEHISCNGKSILGESSGPFFMTVVSDYDKEVNLPPNWRLGAELARGMTFDTLEDLKYCVKLYHIKKGHTFRVKYADRGMWDVVCDCLNLHLDPEDRQPSQDDICKWRMHAAKRKKHGRFEITKYNGPHTCVHSNFPQDHPQLDVNIVAKLIHCKIQACANTPTKNLIEVVHSAFGYTVSEKKIWDAKTRAMKELYGDWDESYNDLQHYLNALQMANPGTVFELTTEETSPGFLTFDKVFWAFGPCIEAFRHCRPIITVGRTRLNGKYSGKLLVACGTDGNNNVLPLAFAVVKEEIGQNWVWFLMLVKSHICSTRNDVCLISDRSTGIDYALTQNEMQVLPPKFHQRFCVRQIIADLSKELDIKSSRVENLISVVANEVQPQKFARLRVLLGLENAHAALWLDNIPRTKWANAYDGGLRYGNMTSNILECYNLVLRDCRGLPITSLVKCTFGGCMKWFAARLAEVESSKQGGIPYCEKPYKTFESWRNRAAGHTVVHFDRLNMLFKVITGKASEGKGGNSHIVQMEDQTCTCGKWQTYRIPCSHVQAACSSVDLNCFQYMSRDYLWDNQLLIYNQRFNLVALSNHEPAINIPKLHPDHSRKRKRGRPKAGHVDNETGVRIELRKNSCKLCGERGHNKRKCQQQGNIESAARKAS